jgi:TolB-like protein
LPALTHDPGGARTASRPPIREENAVERRITTILAADMVGYSAMMAVDEVDVIERLRVIRKALIEPSIRQAGGRIIKLMGDGLLAEIESPDRALDAAVAVQRAMALGQQDVATERRIVFRIGINHGPVVIEGDDILGDAVNIAARLESLSVPGGICISRSVHDLVQPPQGIRLIDFGPQIVKNIPRPVEVWGVQIDGAITVQPRALRRAERPSVAVLPFDLMSADRSQAFLADGIAEDVINELSRFRSLFVVSRSSSFGYRDRVRDLRQIANDLGVRYVVQGSVRSDGTRLRVSAALAEVESGQLIWNDRWERTVSDLFAVQDHITQAIVSAVAPELGANERRMARRKPTEHLNAWELCQKAQAEYYAYSDAGRQACHALLEASILADPNFALPHALLGRLYSTRILTGRSRNPSSDIAQGLVHVERALELDERLEDAHIGHAGLLMAMGREAEGRAALQRAEALNDNSPLLYLTRSCFALFQENPNTTEMESAALEALEVSPRDPLAWAFHAMVGIARLWGSLDDPDPAAAAAFDAACAYPEADYYVLMYGAIMSAHFGRQEEASARIARILAKKPDMSLQGWLSNFRFPYRRVVVPKIQHVLDQLVALGLPRE